MTLIYMIAQENKFIWDYFINLILNEYGENQFELVTIVTKIC